jgi:hypothetical protein
VTKPQLKPQVAQVKALPSQQGSESAQNQGQLVLPQVSQGDFAAFQQMWGNPSFQHFGWKPSFPMQFMPQMVQGNQMQFQQGPFPVQQFLVQSMQQGEMFLLEGRVSLEGVSLMMVVRVVPLL